MFPCSRVVLPRRNWSNSQEKTIQPFWSWTAGWPVPAERSAAVCHRRSAQLRKALSHRGGDAVTATMRPSLPRTRAVVQRQDMCALVYSFASWTDTGLKEPSKSDQVTGPSGKAGVSGSVG